MSPGHWRAGNRSGREQRSPARVRQVLVCVTTLALVVGACANVPRESQPEAVGQDGTQPETEEVEGPEDGLSPAEIVRDFVGSTAQSPDREAAQLYLDEESQRAWQPSGGMVILDDSFDTVPAPAEEQPSGEGASAILLRGTQLGTLGADGAFEPMRQDYERTIQLREQADGQWRIAEPPTEVMTTEDDFSSNYLRVPLYFFAQDSDVRVPDTRYLPRSPQAAQPGRVIDLLLDGPSSGLRHGVQNPLGDGVETQTSVTGAPDGALVVPLTGVQGKSESERERIAEQVVMSLDNVTPSRIRLQSDGDPLLAGDEELRRADVPESSALIVPSTDLPGMSVVGDELHSLETGESIDGPAGAGEYELADAAQSLDGEQLAAVAAHQDGLGLRVGPVHGDLQPAEVTGSRLTRPTWWPTLFEDSVSNEVWTVVDGEQVIRVVQNDEGEWTPVTVDSAELDRFGEISALRLSRDGTRAAVVVDNELVIAAVERADNAVSLRAPRVLREERLSDVEDVDWIDQDTVVVARSSSSRPVVQVSADGFRMEAFRGTNLTSPVHAITAAPGRSVVVSDVLGQWTASDTDDVWQQHPRAQGSMARPFYPG